MKPGFAKEQTQGCSEMSGDAAQGQSALMWSERFNLILVLVVLCGCISFIHHWYADYEKVLMPLEKMWKVDVWVFKKIVFITEQVIRIY